MNFPSWRYNPQLFLTVQSKVLVTVTLNQALTKNFSIGFYLAKAKSESVFTSYISIPSPIFSLILGAESGVRQLAIPSEEIVAHVGFEDLSESKQLHFSTFALRTIPLINEPC